MQRASSEGQQARRDIARRRGSMCRSDDAPKSNGYAAILCFTFIAVVYRFKSHSAFPFNERSVNSRSYHSLPPGEAPTEETRTCSIAGRAPEASADTLLWPASRLGRR